MSAKKIVKKAAKKVAAKKAVKPVKKAAAKKAIKPTKKSAPKLTNVEKLVAAGVIREGKADKHNHAVINKLSVTEITTLIKLRSKLGSLDASADEGLSPNFPV